MIKGFLRCIDISVVYLALSMLIYQSLVKFERQVTVDCKVLKPECLGFRSLFLSKCLYKWLYAIFSKTRYRNGSIEIGL